MQQQFSMLKLTFALVLICFYIFCFGILGTAGDGSGDSYAQIEESSITTTQSTTTTTMTQSTTTQSATTTSQTEQSTTLTTSKAEVTVYSPPKTTTTKKATNVTTTTVTTTTSATTTTNSPIDAEHSLYEYVLMNVQAEMGASFHQEALKAQAVAAYSYIKCQEGRPGYPNVPLASINA